MSDLTLGLVIGGSMLTVFGIAVLILVIGGKSKKKSR
jgi:mannose/fructose/N-acetylgalactosamine-specific phosphotransferase system component IIC